MNRITVISLTPLAAASFDSQGAEARLRALFRVAALDAFGAFGRAELGALGALADYIELTQKGRLPMLRPPRRETPGGVSRHVGPLTRVTAAPRSAAARASA